MKGLTDGRTVSGSLFSTRDTGTDEEQSLGFELLGSSNGVGEVRVSWKNDVNR